MPVSYVESYGMRTTHSLASLHSGAREADMVDEQAEEDLCWKVSETGFK